MVIMMIHVVTGLSIRRYWLGWEGWGHPPPHPSSLSWDHSPLSTLHYRPASERHPPAGVGAERGRASVLVITDHNYHCFVDTMHTEIVVNNGINESEKSRQYFEYDTLHHNQHIEFLSSKTACTFVILCRCFRLIVKNVNCIEMVTAARSEDNCIKSLHRNILHIWEG